MSLSDWESRVELEYGKLREQRNIDIRNAWRKNWDTCTEEFTKSQLKFTWPKRPIQDNPTFPTSKKSIHVLQEFKPIPRMHNWVLSPRNFLVENQNTFFNIPFIEDELQEGRIFQNLLKRIENKEKPEKRSDILEDSMFMALVQALHENNATSSERDSPPDPIIFQAISAFASKEAGVRSGVLQLRKKYEELICEKEDKTDGTCEQILHNPFAKYFCRRCYMYNCELHKKQDDENIPQNMQKQVLKFKAPIESNCSNDCWKLCKEEEPTSSNRIKDSQPEWSSDEKTLFRALQRIFINKYCIIAQAMLTRTCQQVYEFSLTETSSTGDLSTSIIPQRRKKNKGWLFYKRQLANEGARHYFPCNHPFKSCNNDCSCVSSNNACEKFCHCAMDCSNRFVGCKCLGKCNTKKCPCFAASRECDGDLCSRCGAAEYDLHKMVCTNVSIQRGLEKPLLLAPSDVSGWGIFIKYGTEKDSFISEYTGEIITQKEANRRGKIYDLRKSSFLFNLNDQYVLDATYRGSKIRFANHSINPNCYAKVMMVLGNHRIGIFAKTDLLPGEEIFFNYQYNLIQQLKFVAIERKANSL